MDERIPNMMECDECKNVGDFKDEYKPNTLFHKCDGVHSKRMGTWRRHKNKDV